MPIPHKQALLLLVGDALTPMPEGIGGHDVRDLRNNAKKIRGLGNMVSLTTVLSLGFGQNFFPQSDI